MNYRVCVNIKGDLKSLYEDLNVYWDARLQPEDHQTADWKLKVDLWPVLGHEVMEKIPEFD